MTSTGDVIKRIFGGGRTGKRGGKFAAEGCLSDMTITDVGADLTVSASWVSQTKNKQHKLFLAIDTGSFESLEHRCKCAAGQGKCSHLCALYHYLCAGGVFLRSLEGNLCSNVGDGADADAATSCTSKPRV